MQLLLKAHFNVKLASDGEEALNIYSESRPDLVLLDVMMPGLDGLDTLKALKERADKLPVIMLSAANTVRTAVQAMKHGAVDYLNKPFDVEELTDLIVKTLDSSVSQNNRQQSKKENHQEHQQLIGETPCMAELLNKIEQLAQRDSTVLVTGESGTGKELVARRIHDRSNRSDKPFIAINCAAIPETLIESELFGHEKGAFTSAVEKRIGQFELADGGTLFLDEIGELSLPVQVKMLRFLQEQEFFRVGSSTPTKVDVRIIAATNKNLEELVSLKEFRQDLYYRINVIHLVVPPLRERYQDISTLINHFLSKYDVAYGGRTLTFDEEALELLRNYDWPGNVRELENVVESILALCPEDQVTSAVLPPKIRSPQSKDPLELSLQQSSMNFEEAEKKFETDMIIKALERTNYVQTRAAELLGISRRILKYKMDKLGITDQIDEHGAN